MQEQVPSNITPDHGWSQMRTILDREMPVGRRSRRIIFFWRSLMAVGLLGTLSYLVWDNAHMFNTPKDATPVPFEQPVEPTPSINELPGTLDRAAADDPGNSTLQNQVSSLKEEKNVESNPIASMDVKKQQPLSSTDKSIANHHASTTSTTSITTTTKHADNVAVEQSIVALHSDQHTPSSQSSTVDNHRKKSSPTTTASNDIVYSSPTANDVSATGEFKQPSSAVRDEQAVLSLPVLPIDLLPIAQHAVTIDMAIESTPVVATKTPITQLLDVYTAANGMAGYQSGLAWQGSAGLSLKVMPKLRVNAGLAFRAYNTDFSVGHADALGNQDEEFGIVQEDNLYPGIPNYVQDFSLNASTSYQAVQPLVKSVHQWQIEGGLSYDLSKCWFLQTGIAYALRTTAYSAFPIIEDPSVLDPTRIKTNHDLDDYDVIRNGMITLSGGVGYHIGSKLDISFQAVHGLQPYLQSEPALNSSVTSTIERYDYIRGVSLGVHYRFL